MAAAEHDYVVYQRGEEGESDAWDDTVLIKAYDNAVSAMQAKLAEQHPEYSISKPGSSSKKKKKSKSKPKKKKSMADINDTDRQSQIRATYNAVKNRRMSIRQAAQVYQVPRTTLRNKLDGKDPLEKKSKLSLTVEEEKIFSQWAINMARAGFGRTKRDFLTNIQDYLNQLGEDEPRFRNDNLPGNTWYYDYLKRHKELTERTGSSLGAEKAVITPTQIEGWFEALSSYIQEFDPTLLDEPARWYTCDEAGFALSLNSEKVLAPESVKGDRHLDPNTSSTKQQITTVCCMSAAGHFIEPMIVMPGKQLTINPTNDFKECACGLSENGWMNADLFVSWLGGFAKGLEKKKVKKPVLLFIDGCSIHKSKEASNFCVENGIILYCLQPNDTDLIQPPDLAFFGSLKHHWAEAVASYQFQNPGKSVTEVSFARVFKEAYNKSCRPEIAQASFREAGLYPLNKEVVLKTSKTKPSNILVISSSSSSSTSTSSNCTHTPNTSTSPAREPDMKTKMIVIESILTDQLRDVWERRVEEGYDFTDDPFFNTWVECRKLFHQQTSLSTSPTLPHSSSTGEISLSPVAGLSSST